MDRIHQPSPGDILMAARIADHYAHCPTAHAQHEAAEARYAEYGASIRRRDRTQLGLHIIGPRKPATT